MEGILLWSGLVNTREEGGLQCPHVVGIARDTHAGPLMQMDFKPRAKVTAFFAVVKCMLGMVSGGYHFHSLHPQCQQSPETH